MADPQAKSQFQNSFIYIKNPQMNGNDTSFRIVT